MKRIAIGALVVVAVVAGVFAFRHFANERRIQAKIQERAAFYARFGVDSDGSRDFVPLPSFAPHAPGRARIGAKLFNDVRFAAAPNRRCGSCHRLDLGGTDGKVHSKMLTRPVVNAVFADVYLHDASITGFPALVRHMLSDPRHCGVDVAKSVKRLAGDARLIGLFEHAYSSGPTVSNAVDAISEYCLTLFSPRGAFDAYCDGRTNELGKAETTGFALFKQQGCANCHSGPALGLRVVSNGVKVPALRGLAQRRVYFSTGELTDLGAALSAMPGVDDLDDAARADLLAFLRAL